MKSHRTGVFSKAAVIVFAVMFLLGSLTFAENQGAPHKVNINQATAKELAELPGIGMKKAEAIIVHRNEQGKFESVDDLKKVKGIGSAIFEKIKGQVTVEGS